MPTTPFLFFRDGIHLAGKVHRTATDPTERQPAVVVTGSWLTVKEQMADRYAAALAARGYTAFTFDFAHFGQSGGEPRQLESPSAKVADITAVVDTVSTLSFVGPGAPGVLGVCASAQYALAAAARGARIGSLASVAGWYHDTGSVAPFYGGMDGVAARLERARQATEAYLATGEVWTVPAYSRDDDRAAMSFPDDYYADPERGAVPQWRNEMAELSWAHWLAFDGLAAAAAVTAPTLVVHSDGCVFPDHARQVAERIAGPVATVWGDGTQLDYYDRPEQVDAAVDAVDSHFRRTLGGAR